MARADELSNTLKRCREPHPQSVTMTFEDGSKQIIRPSLAFNNDWRGLCEHVANGRSYKVDRS